MAKMLGHDLFTQSEFDKFKKEYDELKFSVQMQADEIKKLQKLAKGTLLLSCLTVLSLVIYLLAS